MIFFAKFRPFMFSGTGLFFQMDSSRYNETRILEYGAKTNGIVCKDNICYERQKIGF